jgi:GT2 family glycosyltransferase/glycosyltransferase involved in cell wall biosynthesis/Tfp pilus assembly protein PilF
VPGAKLISIIIPVHNEFDYTKLCIESIYRYTTTVFELILINNASTDQTPEYLNDIAGVIAIKNKTNHGYVKAVNEGIKKATGDYILLLDNDTIVTTSWLDNLIECIESEPTIGIVGPYTNHASNSQLINVNYKTIEQLQEIAIKFSKQGADSCFEVNDISKFCMLIKKEVIDNIGLLDEEFFPGFYADKDFCRRAQAAGYRLKCAGNVFVHHFGGRTFKNLDISVEELSIKNKELFDKKWGVASSLDTSETGVINLAPTIKIALYARMKLAFESMESSRGPLSEQFHKGLLLYCDKRYFAALQVLQELAEKVPMSSHVKKALFFSLLMVGEFEKAQLLMAGLLKEVSNDYDLLCAAGDCHLILGDFDSAKSYYKLAEKSDRSSLSVRMGILAIERIKTHPKASRFVNSMEALVNFKHQLAKEAEERLNVTYLTVHHGVAGGSKVIFEHVNRLIERGHEAKIVSHWPSPKWFDLHAEVIKAPFNSELHEYIPAKSDVVVGTFWTQMLDLAKSPYGARMFYAQGDQNIFEKDESRRTPDYRQDIQVLADKNQYVPVSMFAVSSGLGSLIKKYYDRDCDVIPGAIDTTLFKPHKRKKNRKPRILMVGAEGLIFKGLHYANKAFQKIKETRDVEVVWVSPQPRKSKQIQCDVYIESPSQAELGKIYADCDVFVSASIYDAFPLPPLEAMACGTPVVASINEGTLSYINDGENCLAVPVRDADAIAEAVNRILGDDLLRERLIKGGFETSSKYSWNNAIDVLEEKIYRMAFLPNPQYTDVLPEEKDKKEQELPANSNSSNIDKEHKQLIDAVGSGYRKVLCVGATLIGTAKELKNRGAEEVICIDFDGEIKDEIKTDIPEGLDKLIGVDLNNLQLDFPDCYFDCVIIDKTVERLFNPWQTLSDIKTYLTANGQLICNIRNTGHVSVVRDLLNGSWQYREEGVLDVVNLRFFTRDSAFSLLVSAGFSVDGLSTHESMDLKDEDFLKQLELSHLASDEFLVNAKVSHFIINATRQVNAIHQNRVVAAQQGQPTKSGQLAQTSLADDRVDAVGADSLKKPKLSLAMIVKNESDDLARCLNSMQEIADEIVVVDTGSTDNTVEIAKEFGAKIINYKWENDFSKARNVSLENATGEWVMFLDADEELVYEDLDKFRKLLDSTEPEGFFFSLFSFIGDKPDDGVVVNTAFRLWRNKPEYRFSGALHEQILAKVQSGNPNIQFSDVRINHYGYLNQAISKKSKPTRNISILKKEIESNPENAFARFNLGVEFLRIKDYEKALVEYKKAFANLTGLEAAYASLLVRNICQCLQELKRHDEALSVLKDAQEAYPNYTDLFYLEGQIWMSKHEPLKAIDAFNNCLRMGDAGREYISQSGVGGHMAANQLARVYSSIGDEKAAVKAYRKALSLNNKDHFSLRELGVMLVDREDPAKLQHYLESIADMSSEDNLLALSAAFAQGKMYDLSLDYLQRLQDSSSNSSKVALFYGECLLNLKRYTSAIDYFGKISDSSQFYGTAILNTAICHILNNEPKKAHKILDNLPDNKGFALLEPLYRGLADVFMDKKPSVLIKTKQREEASRIITDVLRKFLEMQEFDAFEKATVFLSGLGFRDGHAELLLGKTYYSQGYTQMAVESLIRAYELGIADGESFFILGKQAFENGYLEEAKTFFLEALGQGVDELTLYISLVRTLLKTNDKDLAMNYLEEGIVKYPNSLLLVEMKNSLSSITVNNSHEHVLT